MYKKLIFGMMAFALITVLFAACSIKEAANAMQISVSNAKVLQHRALRMAAAAGPRL